LSIARRATLRRAAAHPPKATELNLTDCHRAEAVTQEP
jgi:hypothetical protein